MRVEVTRIGGIATALMVLLWVGGLGWRFFYPASWIGVIIYTPFGFPAFIFAVGGVFGVAAARSDLKGRPFFKKMDNVA